MVCTISLVMCINMVCTISLVMCINTVMSPGDAEVNRLLSLMHRSEQKTTTPWHHSTGHLLEEDQGSAWHRSTGHLDEDHRCRSTGAFSSSVYRALFGASVGYTCGSLYSALPLAKPQYTHMESRHMYWHSSIHSSAEVSAMQGGGQARAARLWGKKKS